MSVADVVVARAAKAQPESGLFSRLDAAKAPPETRPALPPEVTDKELLAFLISQVGGSGSLKSNKVHNVLAGMVLESVLPAAVAATKKALDPNLRGHIDIEAFEEWWHSSKYAAPEYENTWAKKVHIESLRSKLAAEAMSRYLEAQERERQRQATLAEALYDQQNKLASQPKRGQALIKRLRKVEKDVDAVHSTAMHETLAALEEISDMTPEVCDLTLRHLMRHEQWTHGGGGCGGGAGGGGGG